MNKLGASRRDNLVVRVTDGVEIQPRTKISSSTSRAARECLLTDVWSGGESESRGHYSPGHLALRPEGPAWAERKMEPKIAWKVLCL